MRTVNAIMRTQLTESEVMVFLLIQNNNFTYRELGDMLGVNYESVRLAYESAKKKIEKMGEAGLFQTPVDKAVNKTTKKH